MSRIPIPLTHSWRRAATVLLLLPMMLLTAVKAQADTTADEDSTINAVYNEYVACFSADNSSRRFYELSDQLKKHYRKIGDKLNYYRFRLNEALYESDRNMPYKAIETATKLLDEMRADNYDGYSLVYEALGIIFESRGFNGMAEHYYHEAIANLNVADHKKLVSYYLRLANLLKLGQPDKAHQWNEKYYTFIAEVPEYEQLYHYNKSFIAFAENDRKAFDAAEHHFYVINNDLPLSIQAQANAIMHAMHDAFDGQYQTALDSLKTNNGELTELEFHDLRIIIMKRAGLLQEALDESEQRMRVVDSLHSDMLFNNINILNSEVGLAKTQRDASRQRTQLLLWIVGLAVLMIVLLIVWIIVHLRSRQYLAKKNEQLRDALSMAEESDRMKSEFVRSISHEIRTPLNAISGFNEVLNNPDLELSPEERADLVARINENVESITRIVDDMLHVAEQQSTDFNPSQDTILLNRFLQPLIYDLRESVSANIEFRYTTEVINRQQITTNAKVLTSIINHLLQNAVKFTSHGFIELHCAADERQVKISVSDSGTGIAPEKRPHIFQQFYKADKFQQGIGLGLSVSKKMANKLGGDLTLDESYTGGTRFIVNLPNH